MRLSFRCKFSSPKLQYWPKLTKKLGTNIHKHCSPRRISFGIDSRQPLLSMRSAYRYAGCSIWRILTGGFEHGTGRLASTWCWLQPYAIVTSMTNCKVLCEATKKQWRPSCYRKRHCNCKVITNNQQSDDQHTLCKSRIQDISRAISAYGFIKHSVPTKLRWC